MSTNGASDDLDLADEPAWIMSADGDVTTVEATDICEVLPLIDERGQIPELALLDPSELATRYSAAQPAGSIEIYMNEPDRRTVLTILEHTDGLHPIADNQTGRWRLWRPLGPLRIRGWAIVDQPAGRRARAAGELASLAHVPAWIADRPGIDPPIVEAVQLVIETGASAGPAVEAVRGRFTIQRLVAAPNTLEEALDAARSAADRVRGARILTSAIKADADQRIRDLQLAGISGKGIARWTGFAADTVRKALESGDAEQRETPRRGGHT